MPVELRRVLVFIPSFGDEKALPRLLVAIGSLGERFQPLVIDDGSPMPVLPQGLAGACLHVRLPANFGLGVCMHVAFEHALRSGYDAVVRVDADGQHAVSDVPLLLDKLQQGEADLVIGARKNHAEARHPGRSVMKWYFGFLAGLMAGGALPRDVNSGFFAVSRAGLQILSGTTFERFPEPELFVLAARSGLKVTSVEVNQEPRRDGESTLNWSAGLQMLFRFNMFAIERLLRRRP